MFVPVTVFFSKIRHDRDRDRKSRRSCRCLVLKVKLDYLMSAFLNIVFINSANFIVNFNGKRIDFRDGIFETDKERERVCSLCM